jgi:hypothetical protein
MAINLTMGMDADEVEQLSRGSGAAFRDRDAEQANQRLADGGDDDGAEEAYEDEVSDYGEEEIDADIAEAEDVQEEDM